MKVMPTHLILLVCSVLLASTCSVLPVNAQENTSASQAANDNTVEGTVASASRDTLVIRTDDHFHCSPMSEPRFDRNPSHRATAFV